MRYYAGRLGEVWVGAILWIPAGRSFGGMVTHRRPPENRSDSSNLRSDSVDASRRAARNPQLHYRGGARRRLGPGELDIRIEEVSAAPRSGLSALSLRRRRPSSSRSIYRQRVEDCATLPPTGGLAGDCPIRVPATAHAHSAARGIAVALEAITGAAGARPDQGRR